MPQGMMDKVLSVIIPTYNMEKYLRRCLDSLIVSEENRALLEVLVINDGSVDSSSAIGHEYASDYPQTFRVVDKENGNYGSCINRGLKDATGKYVRILDADDYYQTENLDSFISHLKKSDADLVLTDMLSVFADGSRIRKSYPLDSQTVYDSRLMGLEAFQDRIEMHGVTYKKEILDRRNYRQTEGISYTDQEWICYPMADVDSFCYFPQIIYVYMRDRVGQTMDLDVEMRNVGHYILMVNRMMGFVKDAEFDRPAKEEYARCRLRKTLRTIYKLVLLCQTDDLYRSHVRELEAFDQKIKRDLPFLYDEADSFLVSKEMPFRFVRYWRRKNRRYPHFVLLLYHRLRNLDMMLKKKHLKG